MPKVKCPNHCDAETVSDKSLEAGEARCSSCSWSFDQSSVIASAPVASTRRTSDEDED